MRFGPGGLPECASTTEEGVICCHHLGLNALELEFVRGVYLREENAINLKPLAKKYDVKLSAHAPYWINLAAKEKYKISRSVYHIVKSAEIISMASGKTIVFHPGYYLKRDKKKVYEIISKQLSHVEEIISSKGLKINLGVETTGKHTQFGTLEEIVSLTQEHEMVKPVIDFAHIHARSNGGLQTEDDFKRIFDYVEKQLGRKSVTDFHAHFSCVEYSSKGELRHLDLSVHEPDFSKLVKVIKENGYNGTIISETPVPELGAQQMVMIYNEVKEWTLKK